MIRSSCHPSAVIVGGEGEKDVSRVCAVGTEAQPVSVCVCVCLREKPVDRLVSRSRCHPTPSVLGSVCVCGRVGVGVGVGVGAVTLTYLYSYKKTELVMMVFLPSCNIGHPIYIRPTGRKIWQFCKKIPTPLSAFANKAFPRSSFSPTR